MSWLVQERALPAELLAQFLHVEARGARPARAASPAAVPAACPVIQHCGISRMKAWVAASLATWRPPTTTPSSRSGTRARYGTEIVGNVCDGEGETPTFRFSGQPR